MSEPRSSFFRMFQRPQFWIPCSAAVMTLVFLGKWVLDPQTELPETPDQAGIANDQAQQDLTTEESALGSEIDNLDVLLKQLDFEPSTDQSLAPVPASPSETTLNLPSFSFTNTDSEAGTASASADLNNPESSLLPRSAQNTVAPATESAPSLVTRNEAGTLQLSLTGSPSQPLFGTPQTLGLPQSNLTGTLPGTSSITPQANPPSGTIASPALSSNPTLPYPYNTSGGVPNTAPVQNSATLNQSPASNSSFTPINPYNFSPYGASSVNVTGNTPGNSGFPAGNPNGLVPSPYSLDQSFSDPLAPALIIPPPSGRTLAPGQYIGNGEINTFANP